MLAECRYLIYILKNLRMTNWDFLKDFIYLFLKRGREGKGGKETSMCGCLSSTPTRDLAHNPGMCPD